MHEVTVQKATAGRGGLVAVLFALLMAGAAGCGWEPQSDQSGPGTGATAVSGGATGSPGGIGDETGEAGTQQPAGGYPDTAPAYAGAILAAWAADLSRLGELTIPLVFDQLIQIPGPVDPAWVLIQCDGGDCAFYNAEGDYLLLHVQPDQLGGPQAANHVTFQPTVYPEDHLAYLAEFVTAWQLGNLARMHALAIPEVVAVYQQAQPGPVSDYGLAGGGGGLSIVVVTTAGAEIETHIGVTLLGGPQAIRHAVAEN